MQLDIDNLDQIAPDFYKKDVIVGNNRHLIFYTDHQLKLLAKAKTWYIDGTFRIVNTPWILMFSVIKIPIRYIHIQVVSDN